MAACGDLGRFDPTEMILEYLDEGAGLAILVTDEMGVRGVLDCTTLKATFAEPARARPGVGRARAKPAPVAGRGKRRGGYERGLRGEDEADAAADWDDDDSSVGESRCLMQ